MDGGAIFRVATDGVSADSRAQDLPRADGDVRHDLFLASGAAFGSGDFRGASLLSWVVKIVDGAAVSIAALLTLPLGDWLFARQQSAALVLPDVVALLVFFLASRTARPFSLRFRGTIFQQIRFFGGALALAGLGQAAVLWWLGLPVLAIIQDCVTWVLVVAMGLMTARAISVAALSHPSVKRKLRRRFALVGAGAYAANIAERFKAILRDDMDFEGVFNAAPDAADTISSVGSIADLIALAGRVELDGVIIALAPGPDHESQIAKLCSDLRGIPADVLMVPYLAHGVEAALPMQSIGAMPFMVLQRRPLDERQRFYKRIFDILVSLSGLIILLPLFLFVMIAIKLDSSGPIFFRQPRRGFNNRQFLVFKFRSMYRRQTDIHSLRQTSRDDPRVTRVGKWLRKLSIDELPQLLNVLRGDMSIVGPRPHALQTRVNGELLDDVIGEYGLRYQVKPGITGLAQINGARGELVTRDDVKRRVEYDLEYIQHWSLWTDLKIILLTVRREIISNHAF